MLPFDFLNTYGRTRSRVVSVPMLDFVNLEPDDNRYMIAFWNASTSIRISPAEVDPPLANGFLLSAGDRPLILTHALHGSLVNMSWRLSSDAGASDVIVIEGWMFKRKLTEGIKRVAQKIVQNKPHRWDGGQSGYRR